MESTKRATETTEFRNVAGFKINIHISIIHLCTSHNQNLN